MRKVLILSMLALCGPSLTSLSLDQKIDKAHQEYAKRASGYQSSFLPRVGKYRGEDYRNCIQQEYYRDKDPHDFCSWHAGIGKYQ